MVQARINMDSPIEEIVKTDEGKFILKRSGVEEKCDAVVIAAPLEQSSLKLPSTAAAVHRREFQLTQATFLRGTLKPSYFWNKPSLPNVIYTTENPKLPFSSIGCYTPENGEHHSLTLKTLCLILQKQMPFTRSSQGDH